MTQAKTKKPDVYQVRKGFAGANGMFQVPQNSYVTTNEDDAKRMLASAVIVKRDPPEGEQIIDLDERRTSMALQVKGGSGGRETAAIA